MQYVKESDKRQTVIFEGTLKNKVFSIRRCICTIQPQETEEETQQVADMVAAALNLKTAKDEK
jgi:hypothetical protein